MRWWNPQVPDAVISMMNRLLSERDAYRKLALDLHNYVFIHDIEKQDNWDGKTTTETEVDSEALKILQEKTK